MEIKSFVNWLYQWIANYNSVSRGVSFCYSLYDNVCAIVQAMYRVGVCAFWKQRKINQMERSKGCLF